MTTKELDGAIAAIGMVGTWAPYLDAGQSVIPLSALHDARILWGEADEEMLVGGAMRACDMTIKRLKIQRREPLQTIARRLRPTLDRMAEEDVADLGAEAYDDAATAAKYMTKAMMRGGPWNPLEQLETGARAGMAFIALLLAMVWELSQTMREPMTKIVQRLALEAREIRPTDG